MNAPNLMLKNFLLILSAAMLCALSATAQQTRLNSNLRLDQQLYEALPESTHPAVRRSQDLGRMAPSTLIHEVSLHFARSAQQQAGLDQLLAEQQTPGSPHYHQWLSPQQFADRFAVNSEDLRKAAQWLQAQGFTVDPIPASRDHLSFSGTVAQIEAAFGTEMHNYQYRGAKHFANATELSLPSELAGAVLSVRHLNNFHWRIKNQFSQHPHLTSDISGNTFLVPDDFASIYGLQALYNLGFDGRGRTVVVAGRTDIDQSNIDAFRSAAGLPPTNLVKTLVPNSGAATMSADGRELDEAYLDTEWAGGIARNAQVNFVFVGSDSNKDVDDAVFYAITNKLAPVISVSFGLCESLTTQPTANTFRTMAQQANAQGQTIMAASGDTGAADCEDNSKGTLTTATHGLAVDVPSAIPEVTGVGGSSFSADLNAATQFWGLPNSGAPYSGSARAYISEAAWNDSVAQGSLSSGGGGVSTFVAKPAWQPNLGVQGDSFRYVPDISFNASPVHDGYLICSQGSCVNGLRHSDGTFNPIGGTSVGAPSFAAMLTVMEQAMNSNGEGNINVPMYALAANQNAYSSAFHDITTGNNQVACSTTPDCVNGILGYSAGPGLDLATGLGSVDAYNLQQALGSNLAPGGTTTFTTTSIQSSTATPSFGAGFILTGTTSPAVNQGYMEFMVNGRYVQSQVAIQNGQAQFTPPVGLISGGYNSFVATYYPNGPTYAGSSSQPIQVIVGPDPNVTAGVNLNVNPGTLTIAASGGSQTTVALVTGQNSFSGSVALSCAVTLNGATAVVLPACSFSPSSLTLSVMQATANSQLTLTVPASVAAHLRRPLVEWWTLGSTA
ncbi:MAG: S53 family peptidase, partial [Acidobacteriaceae bacterium]